MQSAGMRKIIIDTMYQNKVEDIYPTVEISAKAIKSLLRKNHNEIFPLNTVVRVVGIEDRDIGGGEKEPYYRLEIREADVAEKPVEDMTPKEIAVKIEEQQ
jgi:hypothetical protein